jgi:hypothetical protein
MEEGMKQIGSKDRSREGKNEGKYKGTLERNNEWKIRKEKRIKEGRFGGM